jgi:hypothetical protein
MRSKKLNESYRDLFFKGGRLDILCGYQEMTRQVAEAADERQVKFGKGLESLEECPCGCGLKNDVCPDRSAAVKRISDEIPF